TYVLRTRTPRSPRTGDEAGGITRTGGGAIRARSHDRRKSTNDVPNGRAIWRYLLGADATKTSRIKWV
ncbi:hypothetical protein THAOC_00900, partial [Thalassiosira oceanica]